MNKPIYILLFIAFFVSCTSNTIIKKPDNLIPKKQMVDLLTDMYIAAGAENIKNLNLERNVNYFPLVFEKYNIDSTRFKESNYYYTSRIDDYDEILAKVEERLKALKKQYDDERKIQDSINRLKKPIKKISRPDLPKIK
ncbi:DUF4296 domain-containing protein [Lutibacter sp. B1]|uniref:DUF4296 domain-containing protein n=1 Tax=Lutibacter sp. B1 TaxID=2725996 RepID=UPI0014571F55|nr:DUF4296 domain-containing protein [Lutibacter sp. B1]NLP57243.1 DUF4296 domain-containing protein [Lutibacter sp. B1]